MCMYWTRRNCWSGTAWQWMPSPCRFQHRTEQTPLGLCGLLPTPHGLWSHSWYEYQNNDWRLWTTSLSWIYRSQPYTGYNQPLPCYWAKTGTAPCGFLWPCEFQDSSPWCTDTDYAPCHTGQTCSQNCIFASFALAAALFGALTNACQNALKNSRLWHWYTGRTNFCSLTPFVTPFVGNVRHQRSRWCLFTYPH